MKGNYVIIKVTWKETNTAKIDIKITLLGAEGAGKSTLIGVLITGKQDDGKGRARKEVSKYFYEDEQGKTTTINMKILGFD